MQIIRIELASKNFKSIPSHGLRIGAQLRREGHKGHKGQGPSHFAKMGESAPFLEKMRSLRLEVK